MSSSLSYTVPTNLIRGFLIEVCLFLQLFQELVTHIGDKREITLGMTLREFAKSWFHNCFQARNVRQPDNTTSERDPSPYTKKSASVSSSASLLFRVSAPYAMNVVFGLYYRIRREYISRYSLLSQISMVTVLGHQLFGYLPILAYRSTPLGTHPLVTIGLI